MARVTWLDENTDTPQIDKLARQLTSFLEAVADGHIDESELKAQEQRVVNLMREIEPLLNDELHAKITSLLCELTAYDIMEIMHCMSQARIRQAFKG